MGFPAGWLARRGGFLDLGGVGVVFSPTPRDPFIHFPVGWASISSPLTTFTKTQDLKRL